MITVSAMFGLNGKPRFTSQAIKFVRGEEIYVLARSKDANHLSNPINTILDLSSALICA